MIEVTISLLQLMEHVAAGRVTAEAAAEHLGTILKAAQAGTATAEALKYAAQQEAADWRERYSEVGHGMRNALGAHQDEPTHQAVGRRMSELALLRLDLAQSRRLLAASEARVGSLRHKLDRANEAVVRLVLGEGVGRVRRPRTPPLDEGTGAQPPVRCHWRVWASGMALIPLNPSSTDK